MDPATVVGLATNALKVVDFAAHVLIKLYRYYLDVKTAALRAPELREIGFALFQLNGITAEPTSDTCALIST